MEDTEAHKNDITDVMNLIERNIQDLDQFDYAESENLRTECKHQNPKYSTGNEAFEAKIQFLPKAQISTNRDSDSKIKEKLTKFKQILNSKKPEVLGLGTSTREIIIQQQRIIKEQDFVADGPLERYIKLEKQAIINNFAENTPELNPDIAPLNSSTQKSSAQKFNADEVLMGLVSLIIIAVLAAFTYKIFESNMHYQQRDMAVQTSSFNTTTTSKLLFGVFRPLE